MDTLLHLSSSVEKSDDSSDSDSDDDDKSRNCFEKITNDEECFFRLEAYENCDKRDYMNGDLAELVVHIASCCDYCNCCNIEKWLGESE